MAARSTVTKTYRDKTVGGRKIRLHRIRAEKALGKPLPIGAVVHHADGSRSDDAPLVICQDAAYHALLHRRMRVRAAGGDPDIHEICSLCREPRPISEFGIARKKRDGRHNVCRDCHRAYMANYRERNHEATP